MNGIKFIRDLGRLCEYVYRKGVADAASSGDNAEIVRIAEREDNYTTYMFLNDENGEKIKERFYMDYLTVYCNKIKAYELRNFIIYGTNNPMKKSVCTIVDYIYRKGLLDGKDVSRNDGLDFFANVDNGTLHHRLNGTKIPIIDWIEEIKHYTNVVSNYKRRANVPNSMYSLSNYIGETIRNSKEL